MFNAEHYFLDVVEANEEEQFYVLPISCLQEYEGLLFLKGPSRPLVYSDFIPGYFVVPRTEKRVIVEHCEEEEDDDN